MILWTLECVLSNRRLFMDKWDIYISAVLLIVFSYDYSKGKDKIFSGIMIFIIVVQFLCWGIVTLAEVVNI